MLNGWLGWSVTGMEGGTNQVTQKPINLALKLKYLVRNLRNKFNKLTFYFINRIVILKMEIRNGQ